MKFIVEPIYTIAEGDFIELQTLQSLLVAPDDSDSPRSLFDNNRFYTGLLSRAEEVLRSRQFEYEVEWTFSPLTRDIREITVPIDLLPGIELRSHQIAAVQKSLAQGRGIVVAGTGAGKTEIACAVAKILGMKTLFMCDRIKAAQQACARFTKYGIDAGVVGGGSRELDNQVTVAVVSSLFEGIKRRDDTILKLLSETMCLVIDECHHSSSLSWSTVAEYCLAPIRIGLSASAFEDPDDRCYSDMLLIGLTGEVVCNVPPRWLIDQGFLAEPLVYCVPINTPRIRSHNWRDVYGEGIVKNSYRNQLISSLAILLRDYGHKVLILIQLIDHGRSIMKMMQDKDSLFSYGGEALYRWDGTGLVDDTASLEKLLNEFDSRSSGILVGSTVFDESLDLPSVTSLILAGGGKKYRKTVQRIGRAAHSKNEFVHVFDFWDFQHNYLQKHSRMRCYTYNKLDYKVYSGLGEFTYRTGITVDPQQLVMKYIRDSKSTTQAVTQ